MKRSPLVVALAMSALGASPALAQSAPAAALQAGSPAATPSAAPEPPALAELPPPDPNLHHESAVPEAPPPPASRSMSPGYLAGGLTCLGVGGTTMSFGILGLNAKSSGGWLDFSEIEHVIGGIMLGVGGGVALTGLILLTVGAVRANSPPPSAVLSLPTVRVGLGHASAEWTF